MKRGFDTQRQRRRHRRIEPLRVAGRQHAARARRRLDQPVGVGQRRRQRLLHQHGDAALDERQRDLDVRRRSGTAIVTASTRSSSVGGVGERPRPVLGGDLVGAAGLGVHDADELDAVHRRQQPGMMLAEVTDADDGDA